jgi:hypothetical protein
MYLHYVKAVAEKRGDLSEQPNRSPPHKLIILENTPNEQK